MKAIVLAISLLSTSAFANPGDVFTSAGLKSFQCSSSGSTAVGGDALVESISANVKAADGASAVAAYFASSTIHNWVSDRSLTIDTSALHVTCVEQ